MTSGKMDGFSYNGDGCTIERPEEPVVMTTVWLEELHGFQPEEALSTQLPEADLRSNHQSVAVPTIQG